jgi:hypothetical protein
MQLGVRNPSFQARAGERHVSSTDESRALSSTDGGGFSRLKAAVFGRCMIVAQKAGTGNADGHASPGVDAVLGSRQTVGRAFHEVSNLAPRVLVRLPAVNQTGT